MGRSLTLTLDLDGPVHVMDHGGEGPPILLIHGLGGSHVNWSAVSDSFAHHGHVRAIDLIGFGLTPLQNRSAGFTSQVDLVLRYLRDEVGQPTLLVGNSMGGAVAMYVSAAAPELVSGMVLVDPALPMIRPTFDLGVAKSLLGPIIPGAGARRFQAAADDPESYVDEVFALVCADPARVRPHDRDLAIVMATERAEMPWAADAFSQAATSLFTTLSRRWSFADVIGSSDTPALVIHGDKDRLVNVASARWLCRRVRSDWRLVVLDGVGHTPQMETPERFMEAVDAWLAAQAVDAAPQG
jgi:pimeloyl-ACP methyl ester carboxylesterase